MPDVVIFDCNSGNFLTQKTEIKLQYMLIYHAIFNNKTEKTFNFKGCEMNDNFCNMMNQIFQFMANLLITEVKISYSKLGELSVKFHFINLVCTIVGFQPSQTVIVRPWVYMSFVIIQVYFHALFFIQNRSLLCFLFF